LKLQTGISKPHYTFLALRNPVFKCSKSFVPVLNISKASITSQSKLFKTVVLCNLNIRSSLKEEKKKALCSKRSKKALRETLACYITQLFTPVTKLKAWKLDVRQHGSDL